MQDTEHSFQLMFPLKFIVFVYPKLIQASPRILDTQILRISNLKALIITHANVILPSDDRLITDLLIYKRTDRYIRQNVTSTQRDELKSILWDKGFWNQNRLADWKLKLSGLIPKARLLLDGSELEIRGEDEQSRIMKGFPEQIIRTYPNLRMLRGISYTGSRVRTSPLSQCCGFCA